MASQKLHKITKIVKESAAVPNHRYNIDGVNLGLARFLWREPQGQFQDLASGDYTIEESGNSKYVVISSTQIHEKIESFQVAYIIDFTASTYETDYDVDINTLKNKYNQLVESTQNMWDHLRHLGFVSDVSGFDVILPELDVDEVWVKTATGFRGFSIGSLEDNIQDLINEFKKIADQYLANLNAAGQKWITDITNTGTTQNQIVINQGTFQNDRINTSVANIDNRLQMIWRMYSVLTGSQRFLSGGVITLRIPSNLEKEVNGGIVSGRDGDPRRIYNGGVISDRTVKLPNVLDLGEY